MSSFSVVPNFNELLRQFALLGSKISNFNCSLEISLFPNKIHKKLEYLEKLIMRNSNAEENKKELLNIQESSKLLNLSLSTIYSKVCKREIPVNKQGKRIYFYRHELMKWNKSGRLKTYLEIQNDIEKMSKI